MRITFQFLCLRTISSHDIRIILKINEWSELRFLIFDIQAKGNIFYSEIKLLLILK